MIGITRLLCGTEHWGDSLRYGSGSGHPDPLARRPIVVWNCTRRCNLDCVHCYIDAEGGPQAGELSGDEARAMIDDLASFGVPVLLFSGGEPLVREDVIELGAYANSRGVRAVLSTNGVLITRARARELRTAGFSYVGVSLDGIGENNDRFRGRKGAFDDALRGIGACASEGVRVGLRFTLSRHTVADLPGILDLIEREAIPRACFYHLVYAGRGNALVSDDLSHEQSRAAVDLICTKAEEFHRRGWNTELLTVDNHCDGVYLLQKLRLESPKRALAVEQLLRRNGGNLSGVAIGDIDPQGNVHADQFWQHYSFGNVRQRRFGEIWLDTTDPVMAGLKNRRPLLTGRCAACRYVDLCNGNFRVRAEAVYGDLWAPDPACYLTDEEIGIA